MKIVELLRATADDLYRAAQAADLVGDGAKLRHALHARHTQILETASLIEAAGLAAAELAAEEGRKYPVETDVVDERGITTWHNVGHATVLPDGSETIWLDPARVAHALRLATRHHADHLLRFTVRRGVTL